MDRQAYWQSTINGQSTAYVLSQHTSTQITSLYVYSGSPLAMNPVKGALLESCIPGILQRRILEPAGHQWAQITPHRSGPAGIDNLFVKLNKSGYPRGLMVAEAKFGSSKLGWTRDGRQMSSPWVRSRLIKTAQIYHKLAESIDSHNIVSGVNPNLPQVVIPMKGGAFATLSLARDKLFVNVRNGNVSLAAVQRQTRLIARYLLGAGEGRISYRPQLFKLMHKGEVWTLGIGKLDPSSARTIREVKLSGLYKDLPKEVQWLIRQNIATTLRKYGVHEDAIYGLSERLCRNPSASFPATQTIPRVTWATGFDRGLGISAATATLFAIAFELVRGGFSGHGPDAKQISKFAVVSGIGTGFGYYVGAQVQARIVSTGIGRSLALALPLRHASGSVISGYGGLASGTAASLAFSFVGYWSGFLTAREAKSAAASGVAGAIASVAFTTGSMSLVMTFGTAGTGAAISSLSGAAATNAALAAIGGGTVAAGGGGMALGAGILTGGAALVALAAGASLGFAWNKLSERDRKRLVLGRLSLVEQSLLKA